MILGFLGLAWLMGIAAAAFSDASPWASLAAAGLLAAVSFAYRPRASTLVAAVLGAGLVLAAAWRYESALPPDSPGGIAIYNDNDRLEIRFRALVTSEPDERSTSALYRLSARQVLGADGWADTEGGVLMRGPLPPRFEYGDLLEVEGAVETPPAFPGFDYRDYLARQGIVSLTDYPQVHLLARDQGHPLRAAVIDVRSHLTAALEDALPEPEASLAAAILLGQRSALPADLSADLNATGTSHLVAVSGQNVSLVAALIIAALAWLMGRRTAAGVALAGIVGYAFLVGGQPSVQRAAIMGGLYVTGVALGRQSSAPLAVAVAGAAMTGWQPLLAKDVSFQLSLAATLGLMALAPPLQARAEAVVSRRPVVDSFPGMRLAIELLAVTLAAIAFTLPITAINFHRISLVAPLANLLAVPAFAAVIVTAAVTALAGAVVHPAADLLAWLAWPPVAYMIAVVRALADLPLASVEVTGVGLGHAVGYYTVLAGILWLLIRRPPARTARPAVTAPVRAGLGWPRLVPWPGLAVLLALGSAVLWLAMTTPPSGRLAVTFLDVGQGDAILIRGPEGHKVLVDGGPSPEGLAAALGRHLPFWDRHLDLVVLTHPDADHLAGLFSAFERYEVEAVAASPLPGDSALYRQWRQLIEERGIPYHEAVAGGRIVLGGGAYVEVLHPPPGLPLDADKDANNYSLVLRLVMGRASFVLTSDLQAEGEFALLDEAPALGSVVMQVPHHGSGASSTPELLREVEPLVAVVSVGADNRFGHPAAEVLERLPATLVYRTDRHGDVTISTDGRKLWVETQRRS